MTLHLFESSTEARWLSHRDNDSISSFHSEYQFSRASMPEQSSTIAPATRYSPLAPELAMRHQALADVNCAFQMP